MNTDESRRVELPHAWDRDITNTLIKPLQLRASRTRTNEPWPLRSGKPLAYPCLSVSIRGSNFLAFAPQAFSPMKLV